MDRRRGLLDPRGALLLIAIVVVAAIVVGCGEAIQGEEGLGPGQGLIDDPGGGTDDGGGGTGGTGGGGTGGGGPTGPFDRLHYSDLTYLGAFSAPNTSGFSFSVGAIAYVPTRNTLVVVARDAAQNWHELAIPSPVISPTKSVGDISVATDLSGWMDVMAPLYTALDPAKSIGGLTYFEGRFWVGCYEFYNVAARDNLGIVSVDENYGDPRGAWRVGPSGVNDPIKNVFHANKTHNDVMVIPKSWSDRYTPGKRLAGGRHRGAGAFGGGRGPALYAFEADYNAPHGADLNGVPLMYFEEYGVNWPEYRKADGYHCIWVWSPDQKRQAVIVSVTKGLGPNYYGPGPACTPDKGWHAHPYEPRFYFIDVNDLAEVANGNKLPWEIASYEMVVPPEAWRAPADGADPNCRLSWFRDFAFDEQNSILYATAPKAYLVQPQGNRMIIHAWKVN